MILNPNIEQRMQDRIDKCGECWLWTGNVNDKGYGYVVNNGKRERVHRVAYVLVYGPIPKGLLVEHSCRVRNCVRPTHLRLATNWLLKAERTAKTKPAANSPWSKDFYK